MVKSDEDKQRLLDEKLILSEDSDIAESENDNYDNPFKELRNLIDDKKINVKTILTENQIIINHKLDGICSILDNQKDEYSKKASELISRFSKQFMTLSINKDGKSRSQFIEALHKGDDKVQEVKNAKMNNGVMNI